MNNEVREFFEIPENYLRKNFGVVFRTELINREIGIITNKLILDLGCGNGAISIPYIKYNRITFLDFSEKMLDLVKKSIPQEYFKNALLINIDFHDLPKSEKFDIILMLGVLAHINRPLIETLIKIKDHLITGGRAYIQFTDYDNILTRLFFLFNKSRYEINITSNKEILRLVHMAGLKIIKTVRYATALPGMGILSNDILIRYVRLMTKYKLFNPLKTEYLYVIE